MMNAFVNDNDEGYAALAIAILKCIPTERAFNALSGGSQLKYRKWDEEDYLEVKAMRDEGWMWKDIGEVFGIHPLTAHHMLERWIKRKGEK